MSRPTAARAARADTRAELLAAAQRVIQRQGFAKATVGEITGEAGASLGLLNYHFGSKDDVLAQAFAAFAREDLAELETVALRHGDPPARLAAFLELSGWADRESWRLWVDAWGEATHTATLRSTIEAFARGWRVALATVLADGDRQGCWRCPDPDDMAGRLVAVIDGIGLHATLNPGDVPVATASAWARRLAELELGVELPSAPEPPPQRDAPTPYEARIPIRGRDLDATGRVHPAVLLTYLGEAREAWFEARLAGLGPVPRLEAAHVAADFHRAPARRDAVVVARCVLDGLHGWGLRTRETIETVAGEPVVSAGAALVVCDEEGEPRPMTAAEREAVQS